MNDDTYTIRVKGKYIQRLAVVLAALFALLLIYWFLQQEDSLHREQEQRISQLENQLETCLAEATAWYNATTAQADEFYYYMLRGQQPGTLNHDVSHEFVAQAHALDCIEPKMPTG